MRRVLKKIDECVFVKDFAKALHMLNNLIFYIESLNENYDGQLAFLYYYKASILTLSEDAESALECIIKACELDAENVKYLSLKSNIYKILGDSENAFKTYVRVLEKLPGAVEDKEAFENAIKYAKELYANYQNEEFTQDELFDYFASLYKSKEHNMSEEKLEKNVENVPENLCIFDYKAFASDLSQQSKKLIPEEIKGEDRIYIIEKIEEYVNLAGEALVNDENINYTTDEYKFFTQVIAEWTFHKSIDLIKGGIDGKNRDFILQKIAFTIFEVIKECFRREIEQQNIVDTVEYHVNKVYKETLKELYFEGNISLKIYNNAIDNSNIDVMATKSNLENSFNVQNKTWIKRNLRVYIEPINLFDKYKNELYYKIAVESIEMWANAISEYIDIKYTNDIIESDINIRWELYDKMDTVCTLNWTENYKIYGADITISLAKNDTPEVVKALVLHTIGHSLGLVHSVNKNSVMSESYKAQNICEDDIKQIGYLYKNH